MLTDTDTDTDTGKGTDTKIDAYTVTDVDTKEALPL